MLQNMYVSRLVLLSGHTTIWLMDRYLLEQVGSAKHALFEKETTLAIGAHQFNNYLSQASVSTKVDVHFAARFYT